MDLVEMGNSEVVSVLHYCAMFVIFSMGIHYSKGDGSANEKVLLKLNNSGPGVLDSNFTFDAHLCHVNGSVVDERLYVYDWKDDAFIFDHKTTVNQTKSQIEKVYYSDVIVYKPGTYQMNVTVYKKAAGGKNKRGAKVADGSMEFVLTEKLNGLLHLHQNLSVKRKKPHVFATGVPIVLTANITDNINLVNTSYSWHVDNSSTEAVTPIPNYKFQFEQTGWQYLGVTANGTGLVENPITKEIQKMNKTGLWKDFIWLSDRVSNITYSGNLTYLEGDLLAANVSCEGSAPFYICTNISIDASDRHHCTDFVLMKQCAAELSQNLTSPGNYTVVIVVKNDVSLQSLSVKLAVKPPDFPLAGSALVTLACVVIALFVVSLLIFSYKQQNKSAVRKMETADFDFHPFQSVSSRISTFSVERIRQSVSSLFSSRTDSTSDNDRSYKALRVRSYGAINSDEEVL